MISHTVINQEFKYLAMSCFKFLPLFLSVSLLISGCIGNGGKTNSKGPQPAQADMMDSLQKLDSLVRKTNARKARESINYAIQASNLAKEINTPEAMVKAYIMLGTAYAPVSIDSGYSFYYKALRLADSSGLTEKRGKIMYNLGMLNRKTVNYRNAVLFIDSALRLSFASGDFTTMSNSLNALGMFYLKTGRKEDARKLFDSAFTIAERDKLYIPMGSALGNLARIEPSGNKATSMDLRAIAYLERGNGADEPIANILVNLGYRSENPDSSLHYLTRAIDMVSAEFAPEIIIGAYNNMVYCYLAKNDLASAEKCIVDHAMPVAVKTHNADWQSTVYDTYADVLKRQGNSGAARDYKTKSLEARHAAGRQLQVLAESLDQRNKASKQTGN